MKQLEIRILPKTAQGYPVQVVVDEKQHLAQGMSLPVHFLPKLKCTRIVEN